MSISIVVPVYNEEDCLKECFKQITKIFENTDYELILVNDGSTDGSHQIILQLIENNPKIKYISYSENKGYSCAIKEGFEKSKKDFVSFLDADLQYSPDDLFKMYHYAKNNNLDFVMGVPIKKNKYYNPLRRTTSFFYNAYISFLFGIKLKDPNSLKLMKREYLEKINFILGYGIMIEIEILLGFKIQGIPINTYPINVHERIAGKSKICSLKIISRTIIDCAKLRLFKNKLIKK
ncbi:MAG: glycosyltransferase family 2 protein [bacterium]|nr:glycosyltransferase family 2 protein [bacterium]